MPITHQDKMRRVEAARRLESTMNFPAACQAYRDLVKADPGDAGLHYLLGACLLKLHDSEAALRSLREAIRLRPTVPEFFSTQAIAYRAQHRLEDGLAAVERGLALDPDNISVLEIKGDLLWVRGRVDEAIRTLRPTVEKGCGNPQFLTTYARLLRSAGRDDEAIAILERAIASPEAEGQRLAWPHMMLGAIHEKRGDNEAAWRHYTLANAHRAARFSPDVHDAAVAEIISTWSAARLASLPRANARGSGQLVFIVGMPRSGTSLVEQILASHPGVYGGGELPFLSRAAREMLMPTLEQPSVVERLEGVRQPALDRLASRVIKEMSAPSPRSPRVTDKMPQNFLHLGVAEALFPDARIVHCVRDARDTCLSCYTHLFGGANNQPFSGNLQHLGRYYTAYERLMNHWRSVLKVPILDVVYEELVADLETGSRRLVEFVGLPWHDACLRFWESRRDVTTESTDQVRQPIYTSSIGRWKRFESRLEPLLSSLGPRDRLGQPA